MRVLLAGLAARRGINAAAFLVTVVALTASVLGPMYGRASGEHLVDSRILAEPHYATGLSVALPATENAALGGLENYDPPPPGDLVAEASAVMSGAGVDRFWGAERRWLRDTGHGMRYRERLFMVPLYWREGMCDLAQVSGRCPEAAGEVLVQQTMAESMGLAEGDTLALSFEKLALVTKRAPGGHEVSQETQKRTAAFTVVGTYRIDDPTSAAWYDDSRFVGFDRLDPSMPTGTQAAAEFPTPALLVAPESMTTQTFVGGVDRVVDVSAIDVETMAAAEGSLDAFTTRALDSRALNPASDLELKNIFTEVKAEQTLLGRVMVAALAPLLVLALLVLFALVAAGAAVRRPYVALAKLRGHARGQVVRFAVGEPFLVVLLAVPVAVLIAFGAARLVARGWLTPGIPVTADTTAWAALLAVTLAALGASVVAAHDVMREPLSRALASSLTSRSDSRAGLVVRVAVVAVAVAAVLQLLTSGDQSSQLLALLAPLLVALAVAVGGAALLRSLSARWVRRTGARGSTPAYLAARRLARRPDLANLMIPLLLAVSVITFAGSASAVSDAWRVSRAASEVGAAQNFRTEVSAGRLMAVTREVDPEGRYLAAALVQREGDGAARRVFVDSTRLAAVAAWDDSWSDADLAALADRLRPGTGERLAFTGAEISVSVRDVSLTSDTDAEPRLWIQYVNDDGEQRNIELGPVRNGGDAVTLRAGTSACATRCLVEKLFLTGDAFSVLDVDGRLTLGEVAVDGEPVDWGLEEPGAWRAARPFPVSLVDAPVLLEPGREGLRLEVFLGELPPGSGAQPSMVSGFAAITPSSTPDVVQAVVTSGTPLATARRSGSGNAIAYDEDVVAGTALNGQAVPMHVAAQVKALPRVGSVGVLADLETSLVEFEPPPGAVLLPELWVADGTPQPVLDAVEDAGVGLEPVARLDERLAELRDDAFSLGLRLFLLVGLATLLLAVFGVFAAAVLQSRWRSYEVASLRVVGVSQRSLVRASVLEYVVMLGLAVVLGLASAALSVRLALPVISLGAADEFAPTPDYATPWLVLGVVGTTVFLLATGIALVVSRRTTRLGRPATLRWAEQT